jgi:hypothetical protein
MERRLDICFDAYPAGERFDPAQLPSPVDLDATSSQELALAWRKQWQPGQELRIRFLDGDRALHDKVMHISREWLRHANLAFAFGNQPDAEIQISFAGSGYWSLIGTDAMTREKASTPTMQLGGFTASSDPIEMRGTVLHEFGHAIGCIHEQASPAAAIKWNEPAVYTFYREWQGWDDETIFRNVLQRYGAAEAVFTEHDPSSIMQYPVPKELTTNGFEVGWNNELSDRDIAFISKMYPK